LEGACFGRYFQKMEACLYQSWALFSKSSPSPNTPPLPTKWNRPTTLRHRSQITEGPVLGLFSHTQWPTRNFAGHFVFHNAPLLCFASVSPLNFWQVFPSGTALPKLGPHSTSCLIHPYFFDNAPQT
jgi:hypothetical protein